MRLISEVTSNEKVQIHFESTELKKGYAEIARLHKIDNCDIYLIIKEVEQLRSVRTSNQEVKHVYRRIHLNKCRKPKPAAPKVKPKPEIHTAMAYAFEKAKVKNV
ncbi:hypothetical protein POP12_041 [Pectobacterium phage POP12]|nr:hypothetical protein POP12_041 [Pectobacterium phage POP12]